LIGTFVLFLSIRGRINFLQLGRHGKYKEQRYRQQFEKSFDFLTFNKELTLSQRNIMLVHVTYLKANGKDARKLYFSTDVSMDPATFSE